MIYAGVPAWTDMRPASCIEIPAIGAPPLKTGHGAVIAPDTKAACEV